MRCGMNAHGLVRGLRLGLALAGLAGLLAPDSAAGQGRVALVIGNGEYEHMSVLPNPTNDAADVGTALDRLGFEVTSVMDAGIDALLDEMEAFRRKSAGADVALVFYAGHGIEVQGTNYLIPVDARLANERNVARETLALNELLRDTAGARLQVVILDACRDNPFAGRMAPSDGYRRTVSRGLAPVATPPPAEDGSEILVALSAAPNQVAEDGEGRNSPFAKGLLKYMEEPGLEIGLLFRRVAAAVLAETEERQRPYVEASLVREHYLAGGSGRPSSPPRPTAVEIFDESARPGGGSGAGLKYRILRRGPGGEGVPVDPNTEFRAGDRIRFAFEPNIDGFLYVVLQGTSGRWSTVFPHPQIFGGRNDVVGFGEVMVPPRGAWLELDDTPGTERVFVALSRERIETLPGADGAVSVVQPVDQETLNGLEVYDMGLVFERTSTFVASTQEVYLAQPGRSEVWSMIELVHR